MAEEQKAVRVKEDGEVELRFGFEISDRPQAFRLLITHPIAKERAIEEIPRDSIESIARARPGPRGELPEILERDEPSEAGTFPEGLGFESAG